MSEKIKVACPFYSYGKCFVVEHQNNCPAEGCDVGGNICLSKGIIEAEPVADVHVGDIEPPYSKDMENPIFAKPLKEQINASMCVKCKDNIEAKVPPDCVCIYYKHLVAWITEMLPQERADTEIAGRFDTYHIGYNDAIKEMKHVFGILDCKDCSNWEDYKCGLENRDDCYAYSLYK